MKVTIGYEIPDIDTRDYVIGSSTFAAEFGDIVEVEPNKIRVSRANGETVFTVDIEKE